MAAVKMINVRDLGFAYTLLFEQQRVLNPGLTPDQFKAGLRKAVAEKASAAFAKKQKGAK